jgi:hypothetical protein
MESKGIDQQMAVENWSRRGREAAAAAGQIEVVFTTTLVELLADDPHRIRLRVQDLSTWQVEEVELHHPDRLERISVDVTGRVEGAGSQAGRSPPTSALHSISSRQS